MPGDFKRRGVSVPPTRTEVEALRVAYDVLVTGARANAREFNDHEDDWEAIWLVITQTQGTLITGDAHKHEMVEYVGRYARRVGAVCVAHLHSAWVVHVEDVGSERMREVHRQMLANDGSTEGIAERREIVLLQLHTASVVRQYHARIYRYPDAPPTLGDFGVIYDSATAGEADSIKGAMVDPLREALVRLG